MISSLENDISTWLIDEALANTTIVGQSARGSYSNKEVLYIPLSSRTGTLLSVGFVSYLGHSLGWGSCLFAETQIAYSIAVADWDGILIINLKPYYCLQRNY